MKTVSMLEFRRNARRVLEAIGRGERMILTYRGRAVARLEPPRRGLADVAEDDPLLRIEDFAVDGAGGSLANDEIDRLVYEPL